MRIWRKMSSMLLAAAIAMAPAAVSGDDAACGGDGCGYDGCGDAAGLFAHHGSGGWLASMLGDSNCETTLGYRVWVGPRWEERSGYDNGTLGNFPIDGDVSGVNFGWRSRNVDHLFMSIEGAVVDGAFNTTTGGRTDYDENQIEALFGYTFADDCRTVFVTPYTGFRYRNAENSVVAFSTQLDVDQEVWTAPFGIRADALLSDRLAVGVDARMQWKIDDTQSVRANGVPFTTESSTNQITWRIDAPVTLRLSQRLELEMRPYYEWDRFNSNSVARSTGIDEYGGALNFIVRY